MEVRFTSEQEERIARVAASTGADPEAIVKDATLRLLDADARFRAAVAKGKARANRGDFIDEEEMEARIERMLRS